MTRILIGDAVVEWVSARTNSAFAAASGIGLERNGRIVAGVVYESYNGPNVICHTAIEGKLTREYLWTIFDYPFNQLKVKRVTLPIGEGNTKSRQYAEHLGFKIEARLKDAHPTGALYLYRLRREECRFLTMQRNYAPPRERLAA